MNEKLKTFLIILLVFGISFLVSEFNLTGKYHSDITQNRATLEEGLPEVGLEITSSPNKADVYVSEDFVGKTPLNLQSLTPGHYDITLKKVGYYNLKERVNWGATKKINFDLVKIGEGNLNVKANVDGAEIYINNELKGFTPYLLSLKEGFYDVKISKKNYVDFFAVKSIKAGQSLNLFADLDKGKNGGVNIITEPSEANIFVNDVYFGKTPNFLRLKEGDYTIRVEKKNYEKEESSVNILNGKDIDLNIDLKSGLGTLLIESKPLGAKIYIDGEYFGITPHIATNLNEGLHNLKLTKDYYEDYSEYLNVNNLEKNEINVNLKRK